MGLRRFSPIRTDFAEEKEQENKKPQDTLSAKEGFAWW